MTKLMFEKHEGFTNTYITDELGDELGHINNESYNSNNGAQYSAAELYEIADEMTGSPSREELFEAHKQLLRRTEKLRTRITELTDKLNVRTS